ncbi:MAG: hypothetical protein KJ950_10000 [Proteobacteria bacterium]|nr:hypothetical protein [Pseudomonadota bacterium]MBU1687907.1 hypothetical protein [Pseudomonadota bacterium]
MISFISRDRGTGIVVFHLGGYSLPVAPAFGKFESVGKNGPIGLTKPATDENKFKRIPKNATVSS